MVAQESTSDPQQGMNRPTADQCPACDSPNCRILFTAGDRLFGTTRRTFRIVECRGCRLIRLSPRPTPTELSSYYPPSYWFYPGGTQAERLEELYRRLVLRDHVNFVRRAMESSGESGMILDVGCGGGLFLRMMAERGYQTAGLDFSMDAAVVARHNGVASICGNLALAPLAPSSCAAITMFHVLEHVYDPVAYLESAYSLLRPNGRLIVQVPNAACWQFVLLGEAWNGLDVPRHLLDFRARDLEILLDNCGFETVRHKYFSLRDNPAGCATSIAPWLDPMARKVRRPNEGPRLKLFKDLVYFALAAACLPFTILEAACRAGSTVMVEARKKS